MQLSILIAIVDASYMTSNTKQRVFSQEDHLMSEVLQHPLNGFRPNKFTLSPGTRRGKIGVVFFLGGETSLDHEVQRFNGTIEFN